MAQVASLSVLHPKRDAEIIADHVREGRFQCSLSLVAAGASLISGLEVAYEHYRGSYSQRVMYTPVILSVVLTAAGMAAIFSRRAAQRLLRLTSAVTLADAGVGFYFHLRGIQRRPGGWRLPMTNIIIMGPPVFAPLLFGTAAYLGLIASYLQREDEHGDGKSAFDTVLAHFMPSRTQRVLISDEQDIREGRFQRQTAIVTAVSGC